MDLVSGALADAVRAIAARLRPGDTALLRRALLDAVRSAAEGAGGSEDLPEPVVDLLTRDDVLIALAALAVASPTDRDITPELSMLLKDVDWATAGVDEQDFLRQLVPAARQAVLAAGRAGGPLGFTTLNLRLDDLERQQSAGQPSAAGANPAPTLLPPGVPESLDQLRAVADPAYEPATRWLQARSPVSPSEIASLVSDPPPWLKDGSSRVWRLLSDVAQAYDDSPDAIAAYLQAASRGAVDANRLRARAAYLQFTIGEDNSALLADIESSAENDVFVSTVVAAARQEWRVVLQARPDQEAVAEDAVFLQLLQVIALVHVGDWKAARARALEMHEEAPEKPGIALLAAKTVLGAAEATDGLQQRYEALRTALQLATQARDTRRTWGGTSEQAVEVAAQAAVLLEDFDQVLRLCLPPPDGEALSREAAYPPVRAMAAHISAITGRVDLARALAKGLEGPERNLVLAAIAEADRDDRESERLAREVLKDSEDVTARGQAALTLAGLGRLNVGDVAGLPEREAVMFSALNLAQQQRHEEAYALLRAHADVDTARFVRLSTMLLAKAGQFDLAADRLEEAATRFGDPGLKVRAAEYRAQEGRWDAARLLALEAASALGEGAPAWLEAQRLLVQLYARDSDWRGVEQATRALLAVDATDREAKWLLCLALYNRRNHQGAWDAISAGGSVLDASTSWQAHLLVNLLLEFRPAASTAGELLALAERFNEDERLRAHVIMALAQLPDEQFESDTKLVQRAQQHAADFLGKYPDSKFLTSIPADDQDELVRRLGAMLRPAAERWRAAAQAVSRGAPCGLLAAAAGRPYAAIWPHRAAGHLPMTADDVRQADRTDLFNLSPQVIVDASALHSLALLPELWPHLRVLTKELATTEDSVNDVLAARDSFVVQSAGSMAWDLDADRLQLNEADESTTTLLRERANKMADGLRWLKTIPWRRFETFTELDEGPFRPWIGVVDLAIARGATLYCDDVGLRRLAREHGAATFDTTALLDALHESRQLDEATRDRLYMRLAGEFTVDLPDEPSLVRRLVAQDGYESLPASYLLSRPPFWGNQPQEALNLTRLLLNQVAIERPELLSRWAAMATLGLARTRGIKAAMAVLAEQLLRSSEADIRAALLRAAKSVARELELPDPTPVLVEILRDVIVGVVPPDQATQLILALFSEVSDQERQDVVSALLTLNPPAARGSDAPKASEQVSTLAAQTKDARARLAREMFGSHGTAGG